MGIDLWEFERKAAKDGFSTVAGTDEAGRGPLAGPVVSAAVVLPGSFSVSGIIDSKQLTARKRAFYYGEIYRHALSVGIGIVDAQEIDRINILQASLLSMAIAVKNLRPAPDCLLVDGKFPVLPYLPQSLHQQAIPGGDRLSVSISAASIVAKVTRDRLMEQYDRYYPQFGFSRHKGYPTSCHMEAIQKHGCCPIHRRSFRGVREHAGRSCEWEAGSI